MAAYDIFFYSLAFFLIGILAASLGITFRAIFAAIIILAVVFFLKKWQIWAILTIFILIGAGYYQWNDFQFHKVKITFNQEINFSGIVIDDPQNSFGTQTLAVQLLAFYSGKISVRLPLYPQFHYGDEISFRGKIGKSLNKNFNGVVDFPQEANLEKSGLGSPIRAALFKFKNSLANSYNKILAPAPAALLAGLTFGERGNLSNNFKQAMSLSGTTHLTALSGQNITLIVAALAAILGLIFSPGLTFLVTIFIILSFVAMTGFDISAVRAAIMGIAVLLAKFSGRIYDPRNILVLAALLINLFNPKALVFDVGFQLSFLAVLGIIYLLPALRKLLRFKEELGFLAWRENFLMTLSAQLATAPLLIIYFNNFSLTALIANILILMFIPLTMALGFLIGFVYFLSSYLSLILAVLAGWLLNYEIFIINFFAKIAWQPFRSGLNFWAILVYYVVLVGLIIWSRGDLDFLTRRLYDRKH